jgi:hypothetical protein
MNGHLDAFIHLDRTFSKLALTRDASDDSDLGVMHSRHGALQWTDLLSHHRVILLSEAGSGKTAEIRNAASRLRDEGESAFFLRIEYVRDSLEDAFEVGTFEEFESWCSSNAEGWLFLDSVDEARLRSPQDFDLAIRKLGRLTRGVWPRAHILIAGRSTAWRARTDLLLCEQAFGYKPDTQRAVGSQAGGLTDVAKFAPIDADLESPFLLVTLDDIHGAQIDRFLNAKGVENIQAFCTEVERKDAWSLTTRPQDFLELIDFWHTHHRIGTRFELMKSSIDRRLEERDQNRSESKPMAPDKLREGVRLVAAGATLGQTPSIRVPDGEENKKGIPIRELLKSWNDTDCAILLGRPIFDEGIYGTVRFHHRTVREYLTAEWLYELIRDSASRVKIENLFFRTQYGLEVINPTMRPILPWLVLLDERIRTRVARVAPEVFFEGGDPGHLPLDIRRDILRKTCDQLAQPAHSWSMAAYAGVQRFANADLSQDIKELLEVYRTNDDIVSFLLRMIWQGEIVDAVEEAKQLAITSTRKHSRIAAIRAVTDLGTTQDIAEIREALLAGTGEVNRDLLAELIGDKPLDDQWLPWLLTAIKRTAKKGRHSGSDSLTARLTSLTTEFPIQSIPALIRGFSKLLAEPPYVEQGFCTFSKRYGWLMSIVGTAVLRLLEAGDSFSFDDTVLTILCKLPQAQIYDQLEARELCISLKEIVPTWEQLNYRLFWHDVALARKDRAQRGGPVVSVWQLTGFQPFWSLSEQNFEVACDDIAGHLEMDDRLMALSFAFQVFEDNAKPAAWERRLRDATKSSSELSENLENRLNPPVTEPQEWELEQARWKEEAARRKDLEEERRRSWREGLAADISRLNGNEPGVMTHSHVYLMDRMRGGDSNIWRSGDWQSLNEEFGATVAKAFRDGAIKFWRGYCPKLRSEGAPSNSIPYDVIFGLIGIGIEAREEPSSFAQMSVEDAEHAARYGLLELNGLPEWMSDLFRLHPETVQEVVLREIDSELAEDPECLSCDISRKVRWSGSWMHEQLAAPLMARLEKAEKSLEATQIALSIVQDNATISDENLAKLVSKRAEKETDVEIAPTWYGVWIGAEPSLGIPALAARIDTLPTAEMKAKFAMLCLIVIVGNRLTSRSRENYKTVQHAKTLYLLIHTHVRVADDIDRAGKGVFSPGLRDDAQAARETLLAFIRETPGKEAFLALEEIGREHPAEHLRPWSAFYAQKKAEADAQTAPWDPAKVIEFHSALESTPSTHRELWYLAIDRLTDLKHDLEESDSSYAEILLLTNQETSIRKYIGSWCRDRAASRYVVPQEEQLADDKRPDYRFQNSNFYAPVPVELKLSQNWSGAEHFERLENQLCGDYLRDINSSCGIFLLVNHGGQATWETPNKGRVRFDDLVVALQEHWLTIAPRFPDVEDIKVIGIDLTKRGGRAAAKAIESNQAKVSQKNDESNP